MQVDSESHHSVTETEWMSNNTLLSNALNKLDFTPEIDLFTSRLKAQFPRYIAYRPDPGVWAVDAFTIDWFLLKFYAFPPFSVILAGLCVLPQWPTQAGFPTTIKGPLTNKIYQTKSGKNAKETNAESNLMPV